MGILARVAAKAFNQGVGTLAAGAHIIQSGGGRSYSGINVTTDRAMRYAAFWAATRVLAESIATLPIQVIERSRSGKRRVVDDHPVHIALHWMPNPQMSAFTFKEVAQAHVSTWGGTYSLKVRDGIGQLRQLWPLDPSRVEVERQSETGDLVYRYQRMDGSTREFDRSQVFHIPGLGWDGVTGYSVLRMARESIGLGLAAEEHGARFFGQGATTNFALTTPNKLGDQAWRRLKQQIKTEKAGLSNAWEPWILEEGLSVANLQMPNDDAQWLETRKHQVTDIARWFRIPPHMIMDLERATFSNIEYQALEFVKYTLLPWVLRWELAIGQQLLDDDWAGRGGRLYAKFNLGMLERADLKTRYESYAIGRQWGFINGDRIADLEDWDRWEGGDEFLIPTNMTTLGPDGLVTMTQLTRSASANGMNNDGVNGSKPPAEPVEAT